MICFKYAKVIFFNYSASFLITFSAVRPYRHSERNKIHIFCTYSDPDRLFFLYKYYLCQERCPGIQ